jgi:hypothetical protein
MSDVSALCRPGVEVPPRGFDRLSPAWMHWCEPWPIDARHADWGHALAACGPRPVARFALALARALRPRVTSVELAPIVDDALACVTAWVERPDAAHVAKATAVAARLYFDWSDVKYARYEQDGDCPRRPLDAAVLAVCALRLPDEAPQVAAATLAIAEEQGLRDALLAELEAWARTQP